MVRRPNAKLQRQCFIVSEGRLIAHPKSCRGCFGRHRSGFQQAALWLIVAEQHLVGEHCRRRQYLEAPHGDAAIVLLDNLQDIGAGIRRRDVLRDLGDVRALGARRRHDGVGDIEIVVAGEPVLFGYRGTAFLKERINLKALKLLESCSRLACRCDALVFLFKTNPLRDVAGLLRSIDYVGATLIDRRAIHAVPVDEAQRDQLIDRFRARTSTSFLRAYWEASGSSGGAAARALLDLFLIEKAAYEITYEVANRPTWIGVPLAGMARLVARITEKETGGRCD